MTDLGQAVEEFVDIIRTASDDPNDTVNVRFTQRETALISMGLLAIRDSAQYGDDGTRIMLKIADAIRGQKESLGPVRLEGF